MLLRLGLLSAYPATEYLPDGHYFTLADLNKGKSVADGDFLWILWRRNNPLVGHVNLYDIDSEFANGTLVPHVNSAVPLNDAILQLLIEEYFTPSAIQIADVYATDIVEYLSLRIGLEDCDASFQQVFVQVSNSLHSFLADAFQQLEAMLLSLDESSLDQKALDDLIELYDVENLGSLSAHVAAYQKYYNDGVNLCEENEERFTFQMAGTPDGVAFLAEFRTIISEFQLLIDNLPNAYEAAQTQWNAFLAAVYALIDVDPPTPPATNKILLFFSGFLPSGLATVATWIVKYIFFGWLWGRWL